MANPQHVAILFEGVEAWNSWRARNSTWFPNLSGENLGGRNLSLGSFGSAKCGAVIFAKANLVGADFCGADLSEADLTGANLAGAKMIGSDLRGANLSSAVLRKTDFANAVFGGTKLVDLDLSTAVGLDSVRHVGPSSIGLDTFFASHGKIAEIFLRGCGIPEIFLNYASSLVSNPFEFYSCFISYSSNDQDFAQRLHADLQAKGIRCWFAPEDLKIGDKFRNEIDNAIRVHDKLLLVISTNSLTSDWVDQEVETALEREQTTRQKVLFPLRLDDAINLVKSGWPAQIRRARQIGDFSRWKDQDSYQQAFARLIRDLRDIDEKRR